MAVLKYKDPFGNWQLLEGVSGVSIDGVEYTPGVNGVITLPVDQAPTASSKNLLPSGVVKTEFDNTNGAIAIVQTGDNATQTIDAGSFVLWKGVLYTADASIPSGDPFATSGGSKNLTAVLNGGLNALNDDIGVLNDRLAQFGDMRVFTSTVPKNGRRVIRAPSGKNLPCLIFTYYAQAAAYLSGTFAIVGDGVLEGSAKMASLFTPGSTITVRSGSTGGTNYTSVVLENSSTSTDARLILISLNSTETITFV